MSEFTKPAMSDIANTVAENYPVGSVLSVTRLDVGLQAHSAKLDTSSGSYIGKITDLQEARRAAAITELALEAGVNHPELLRTIDNQPVCAIGEAALMLMRFAEGTTFYDDRRMPTLDEYREIIEQAAQIHTIDIDDQQFKLVVDEWAIPNIETTLAKVYKNINTDDITLIQEVIRRFQVLPKKDLPQAFIHNDISQDNVIVNVRAESKITIIDFGVAAKYPRIQELGVIIANLWPPEQGDLSLVERCTQTADMYDLYVENQLTDQERSCLPTYALAGMVMNYIGAVSTQIKKGESKQTNYLLELGRYNLRKSFAEEAA